MNFLKHFYVVAETVWRKESVTIVIASEIAMSLSCPDPFPPRCRDSMEESVSIMIASEIAMSCPDFPPPFPPRHLALITGRDVEIPGC